MLDRRSIYVLLAVIAVAIACSHIVSAQRVYDPASYRLDNWPKTRPNPLPIYSSNDRSRWATVRALVDNGTFVIGKRDLRTVQSSAIAPLGQLDPMGAATLAAAGYGERVAKSSNTGIIFEDGWESVDKVLDPDTMDFYSSKPPLLSTLVAGLYWLLHLLTGWTLTDQPNEVIRTLLLLINGLPFAIYLRQLAHLVEDWGRTDWARLYVFAVGAFATLVTPFLVTFNNHIVGTFAVMFAWVSLLRIARQPDNAPPWYHFVSVGFFSAFAATNELPALAFAAAVFALLVWWYPRRALLMALPPALVVAAAFFVTNYAALGTWKVAYANTESVWYQYEGSHWRLAEGQKKTGIDWTRKGRPPDEREGDFAYGVHVLIGHHGWFSLTPVWLLAAAGMAVAWWRRRRPSAPLPAIVPDVTFFVSAVVILFYLAASDNYGVFTNGLRWLMWLTPMWLTCLLPMVDLLAENRWGRRFAYALLAVSIFSVNYEPWNPWRHPWIYDLMIECGWRGY